MDERQDALIDRMTQRLAPPTAAKPRAAPRIAMPRIDWRFVAAMAGMAALGPLATIIGADVLAGRAMTEAARAQARAAPVLKAEQADLAARDLLRRVQDTPTVAVLIDRVAAQLPAEARIVRAARPASGGLTLEISTADPDQLRGQLRRDPLLRTFRETGQRRAGAMIVVTLRQAGGRP
ncbi:MAG: hypothetical protein CVT77_13435 [Alphaproteobacteria bacterium HGW-Alphaproteobacteria-16]|nr:MAG: hypothetical protein CVT77_13435 [Alphaproteobacteria bacterium HGW-Alphaproteobacteria-16]